MRLLIRHLDTKDKNTSELGLYGLTRADGEHKFRGSWPRGQLFAAHYPPPQVSSEAHLPCETSPTLYLTYLVPMQLGHYQGCRNSVCGCSLSEFHQHYYILIT